MKNKLIIGIVILLLLPIVNALGIAPGRTTLNFESNLEKIVTVRVINNENKNFNSIIYVSGELKDYITISTDSLSFNENENEKTFTYTVSLPEKLSEPGLHKSEVIVREVSIDESGEGLNIGALVAVATQLYVHVPFPGKFLKIQLQVKEAKPGEIVKFFIPVTSLGEEDTTAKARIHIYDNNKQIVRIESIEKIIKTKERTEFVIDWKADVRPGTYRAVAVVEYDGKTASAESQFLVGDFFLKVLDISVKDFTLGEIAKFSILVENIGNTLIIEAFSEIILNSLEGKRVADLKSNSIDIEAVEKKEMEVFWDTENIETGEYTGKIILSYDNKFSERQIRTIVEDNAIRTEIIGITGLVIGTETPSPLKIKPIYIFIAVLVLMNVAWFIYFKRRK